MVATPHDDSLEILSESECWRLLRLVDVGRIAIPTDDHGVDVFPINFVVDHGTIVFRTAAGTKLTRVERAPVVAFEADDSNLDNGIAWSVVVKGHAEMIDDLTDVLDVFELDVRPWHESNKPYFVRLAPTSTTGRRFVRPPRSATPDEADGVDRENA